MSFILTVRMDSDYEIDKDIVIVLLAGGFRRPARFVVLNCRAELCAKLKENDRVQEDLK